jgi:biofilm PGA synthesis N-glycosyltransferase PgaC
MALLFSALLLLALYALLLLYYGRSWRALPHIKAKLEEPPPRLSIVIAARNEAHHLPRLLQALQRQTYPTAAFEVIVVDDYSTDDTAAIAGSFPLPGLRVLRPGVDAASSSKKKAIEAGVAAATGELIVTTDADCLPGSRWLEALAAFYRHTGAVFIAAPVSYTYTSSWLERFQALDFMTLQGITGASVQGGLHAMCNGANLAYTLEAFREVNGFEGIDRVATGDDMLLMHKIWQRYPGRVAYLKNPEAIVHTPPMPTWKSFLMQRKRWASKTFVYDDYRIIAVLALVYLVNLFFFILLLAGCWKAHYLLYAAAYLLIKTVIELPFLLPVARFFGEERLLRFFLLFQPAHLFYTTVIGPLSQLGKYEWKGRRTE